LAAGFVASVISEVLLILVEVIFTNATDRRRFVSKKILIRSPSHPAPLAPLPDRELLDLSPLGNHRPDRALRCRPCVWPTPSRWTIRPKRRAPSA